MRCKLDSTKYALRFENTNPALKFTVKTRLLSSWVQRKKGKTRFERHQVGAPTVVA